MAKKKAVKKKAKKHAEKCDSELKIEGKFIDVIYAAVKK
jgi:hypothetical protein